MARLFTRAHRVPSRGSKSSLRGDSEPWTASRVTALVVLGSAILVLPWFFGGVQAHIYFWLAAAVLVALACHVIGMLGRAEAECSPVVWTNLLLVGGVVLGLAQIIPLPAAIHARIAPASAELWNSLAAPTEGELGAGTDDGARKSRPMSLNPAATRWDVGRLATAAAIFFLASWLLDRRSALIGMLAVVTANGAAVSFFGIAQQLTWNGMIYGFVPLTAGGSPFASFVNRNHAASFLNLSLGCAIGLTILAFSRKGPQGDPRKIEIDVLKRDWQLATLGRRMWLMVVRAEMLIARLDGLTLFGIAASGLIIAGILCSMSRGAWISGIGAAITVVLVTGLIQRKWMKAVALVVVLGIGLGFADWLGQLPAMRERFGTLLQQRYSPDGRFGHWRDGLVAAVDFLPLGSGLGTYRYAYRLTRQHSDRAWFYHAENQFLEGLVEAGVPGLLLLLLSIGLVGVASWRLLLWSGESIEHAVGVMGLFVLTAQVIHSMADFSLYIPANMALFALLCGCVCAIAVRRREPRRGAPTGKS